MLGRMLALTWRRVRRLWRPMAGWTFAVWALTAAVVSPLASYLVGGLLIGSERVVGNDALIGFALSPRGLTYILLAGTVALTTAVVRYAGLFFVVLDDVDGDAPSLPAIARHVASMLPALFRLCLASVLAGFVLILPLAAGLGAIYLGMLGEHDINYYLDARPPEWQRALVLAGLGATVWAGGAAYIVARSLLALPAYLDGHRPVRAALRNAWARTRGRAGRILWQTPLLACVWLLARAAVNGTLLGLASIGLERVAEASTSLLSIMAAVAIYTGVSLALDAVLSFAGFSMAATLLTTSYCEDTDLHRARPHQVEPPLAPRQAEVIGRWFRPARLMWAVAVLAALGLSTGSVLLEVLSEPPRLVVTAHRAGASHAPENTLLALERAIAAGADVVEIDVQRTSDGVVVVAHDADLMRVARDPRRIAGTTYAAFHDVVMGLDDGTPVEDRRLATLDEFLDRSRGRVTLLIELKYYGWDAELVPQVLAQVRARGMEREVWMMSLNLDAVKQVQGLAPTMITGYLASVAVGTPTALPVQFLAVSRRLATPRFIRDADARRVPVHVWTINQADALVEVADRGATGVITDDVPLAARLRDELASLPAAAHLLLRVRGVVLDESDEFEGIDEQ
jgi:glycerophosphoryl diester phosphodiesterase